MFASCYVEAASALLLITSLGSILLDMTLVSSMKEIRFVDEVANLFIVRICVSLKIDATHVKPFIALQWALSALITINSHTTYGICFPLKLQ